MDEMTNMDLKPSNEPLPEILQEFIKNRPDKRLDNLYHIRVVDLNGDTVEEAVGANVMTDIGLEGIYKYESVYTKQTLYLYLGADGTPPSTSSTTISDPIGALNSQAGKNSRKTGIWTNGTYSYDPTTKIWSTIVTTLQYYWDYTDGDNNSYYIYELGLGNGINKLMTHSLIYDEHGTQIHITKSPNTRLYITVYLKTSVSVKDIPRLYEEGKFLYVKPTLPIRFGNNGSFYFCPVVRCENEMFYGYNSNGTVLTTYSFDNEATGSEGIVEHQDGPEHDENTWFWQDNYVYTPGFLITDSERQTYVYQTPVRTFNGSTYAAGNKIAMFTLDKMPIAELLVSDYAYINDLSTFIDISSTTYSGDETNNVDLIRLNNNFGLMTHPRIDEPETSTSTNIKGWKRPYGTFPCTDFHITKLSLYNYQTKKFDIPVDYYNNPNKEYLDIQNRMYISLYVNFDGVDKTVYAFINMYLYDKSTTPPTQRVITSFDNSSITICATDTYWDTSTYEKIPDLSNVPANLGSKRYYIITSGTVAQLKPKYHDSKTNSDQFIENHDCHYIIPSTYNDNPFELTHDSNALFPKHIPNTPKTESFNAGSDYGGTGGEGSWMQYEDKTAGCKPIFDQSEGWFLTDYMLVYLNKNKECAYYDMTLDDGTVGCRVRRYKTANSDKILMFKAYHSTVVSTGTSRNTTYLKAKNDFSIFTLVDKNTAPTREDLSLTMSSTTSLTTTGNYHSYSWSNLGYLVAQRMVGADEFVIVDVYGDGTNATQTLVSNAKHARAIIDTEYCVYMDTLESYDKHYIFKIYDMSTNTVVNQFEIADGSSYTINGVFGWRDHIYVSKTVQSEKTIFYYNKDTGSSESFSNNALHFYIATAMPFYLSDTLSYDDFLIITAITGGYNSRIIYDNEPTTVISLFDTPTIQTNVSTKCTWPSINLMNDGKSLILVLHNPTYLTCVDFGYIRDKENGVIHHIPYEHYTIHTNGGSLDGCVFPFNDGIMIEVGSTRYRGQTYYVSPYCGRWFWLPLECCIPLHMEGYTNTINSYNQPIKFSITKKLEWKATNRYSNIPSE